MRNLLLREYMFDAMLDVWERGAAARDDWQRDPLPADHPCAGCAKNRPGREWIVTSLQNFSGGLEALLRTVATHFDGWQVSMNAGPEQLVDRLSQRAGKRPPLLPADERATVLNWLRLRRKPAVEMTGEEVTAVLRDFSRAWDACEAQLREFMAFLAEEGRHERPWGYER